MPSLNRYQHMGNRASRIRRDLCLIATPTSRIAFLSEDEANLHHAPLETSHSILCFLRDGLVCAWPLTTPWNLTLNLLEKRSSNRPYRKFQLRESLHHLV